jgi:hypothetical protein
LGIVVNHTVAPNISLNGSNTWYSYMNVEFRLNGNSAQILYTVQNQSSMDTISGHCVSVENGDGTYTSTFELFIPNAVIGATASQTQVDMCAAGWFESGFTGLFGNMNWGATHVITADGIQAKA